MPRPTTTPRLSALDPVKFAVETVGEVQQRLYDLGCCLCLDSSLEADLILLCRYARGEVYLKDATSRTIAKRAAGPIYLGQEELGEPSRLHDDWRGRCDIVFRAAIKRGEIATEHGVIPAAEAKRWMEAKGVAI